MADLFNRARSESIIVPRPNSKTQWKAWYGFGVWPVKIAHSAFVAILEHDLESLMADYFLQKDSSDNAIF